MRYQIYSRIDGIFEVLSDRVLKYSRGEETTVVTGKRILAVQLSDGNDYLICVALYSGRRYVNSSPNRQIREGKVPENYNDQLKMYAH